MFPIVYVTCQEPVLMKAKVGDLLKALKSIVIGIERISSKD